MIPRTLNPAILASNLFGTGRLILATDFPHVYQGCNYEEGIRWITKLPFLIPDGRTMISDTNARTLWKF